MEPSDRPNFTPDEEERIMEALRSGGLPPPCPRCGTRLEASDVPPRTDVAYVRHRLWLVCGRCRRSFVVDRRTLR